MQWQMATSGVPGHKTPETRPPAPIPNVWLELLPREAWILSRGSRTQGVNLSQPCLSQTRSSAIESHPPSYRRGGGTECRAGEPIELFLFSPHHCAGFLFLLSSPVSRALSPRAPRPRRVLLLRRLRLLNLHSLTLSHLLSHTQLTLTDFATLTRTHSTYIH